MAKHTTSDIAKRLNIHVNTVRKWTTDYAEYLSDSAQRKYKKYSHDDTVVLATVAKYREQGFAPETIKKLLAKGERVDTLPRLPTVEEVKAREGIELIPKPELDLAKERITSLEEQLTKALEQRDTVLVKSDEQAKALNSRIAELERQLGTERGRIEVMQTERSRLFRVLVALVALVAVVVVSLVVVLVVVLLMR